MYAITNPGSNKTYAHIHDSIWVIVFGYTSTYATQIPSLYARCVPVGLLQRDAYISTFAFHQSELCGLDISPSESLLASGGNDNLLCVWDIRKTVNCRPETAAGPGCYAAGKIWGLPRQHEALPDLVSLLPADRQSFGGLGGLSIRPTGRSSPGQGDIPIFSGGPISGNQRDTIGRIPLGGPAGGIYGPMGAVWGAPLGVPLGGLLSVTTSTRSSPEQPTLPSDQISGAFPLPSSSFSPASHVSLPPLPPGRMQQRQQQPLQQLDTAMRVGEPSATAATREATAVAMAGGRTTRAGTTAPLFVYNEHRAAIKAVKFCPQADGLLASGGGTADRHIRFWNAKM